MPLVKDSANDQTYKGADGEDGFRYDNDAQKEEVDEQPLSALGCKILFCGKQTSGNKHDDGGNPIKHPLEGGIAFAPQQIVLVDEQVGQDY